MAEPAATRSAALALADERALMRQGYGFLDEKRMLLAARLLRELRAHEVLRAQLAAALEQALDALRAALQRHGLEALQVYPVAHDASATATSRSAFLGVSLLQARLEPAPASGAAPDAALDASPQAQACREAFAALLEPLAQAAAMAGNLERLAAEYRRSERRARALENVLLPEVERSLALVLAQLELADQEEAVRLRRAARAR